MKKHWLYDSFLFILGICVNAVLLAAVVWLINDYAQTGYNAGWRFSQEMTAERPDRPVEFVLEEDTPAAEVAARLEDLDVIANQYMWRLELFLKDSTKVFKAGTYQLNSNMSNTEVNVTLRSQPVDVRPDNRITIPEGYTVRDIATYLDDQGLVPAAEFIEACNTLDFAYSFLEDIPADIPERTNRLEGYLFPDTYFISPEPDAREIVGKMLARFEEVYTTEMRARAAELGWTMDQVVTMASLIEKEVSVAEERPVVSQVIYNRLTEGMPLQLDCTIQFILDKRKDRILESDLQVDSPYNTYRNPGLPVGPISNPGASCLNAVLYPEENDYLYYVLRNDDTGAHEFNETYEAHLAAIERYGT